MSTFGNANKQIGKRYNVQRRYSIPRRFINPQKSKPSKMLKLKSRNFGVSFVLAIFMLCMILTSSSEVLSAYFTDIKHLSNLFSIDAEYTITFDANTGTGTMAQQTASYNIATPLNPNTFTKSGYLFDGWNTSSDGNGTAYIDEQSINNLGDITLYAQWIESTDCTITFVYGDADFDGHAYINSGIPLFNSNNIHRDFEVKSTISNFTYNPGQNQNRNAIICNQYEGASPYQGFAMMYRDGAIKVQGNSNELGSPVSWGKQEGTIIFTRTDNKLYYDGNNFLVDYANIAGQFSAPLSFGANLDATGEPRRFSKVTMSDTEVKLTYSLSEITSLVLPTPTKTGVIFDGWYTQPVGGTKITTPTIAQLANKKVYAHWGELPTSYTVIFDSNGGTGTMSNQIIDYGVPTALNQNTYTNDGTFKGWNTHSDGSGTHYDDEDVVTDLGDITLYAEWLENAYTLTYFYGNESFNGNNYIDSGIGLFSTDNINRDFELSLNLTRFNVLTGNTNDRNTILTNHYEEKSPNPGFSFVYRDNTLGAQANKTKLKEKFVVWNQIPGNINFKRAGTVLTFNNQFMMDFTNTKYFPFEEHLIFGTNIDQNGIPRRYCDADLTDISLTLNYTKREFPNITLPIPTRTGYTFDGWYTQAVGGTQVTTLTYEDFAGETIYAHWTEN